MTSSSLDDSTVDVPHIFVMTTRERVERRLSTGQTIVLTPADERRLKLAFNRLAGYRKRVLLQRSLQQKQEQLQAIANHDRHNELVEIVVESKLQSEIAASRAKIKQLSLATDRKISCKDLEAILESLGCNYSRREIEV